MYNFFDSTSLIYAVVLLSLYILFSIKARKARRAVCTIAVFSFVVERLLISQEDKIISMIRSMEFYTLIVLFRLLMWAFCLTVIFVYAVVNLIKKEIDKNKYS